LRVNFKFHGERKGIIMPEINTHIAVGLGVSYLGAKIVGLDTDYLVIGIVGALLSASSHPPLETDCKENTAYCKIKNTCMAIVNLTAIGFFAASGVSILIQYRPEINQVAVPVAGLIGFFGQPLIQSVSAFINGSSKALLALISNKIGGRNE
jgi:hypothetical protein